MSLALHFFKRDVRRIFWTLILWLLIYFVEAILTLTTLPSIGDPFAIGLSRWLVYPVLHIIVLGMLVAPIVQEDSVVTSTAFWLTRPVARKTLLQAKAMALGLIVLIPLVIYLAALSKFGLSGGDLVRAAFVIVLRQLYYALPIAFLAAMTENFLRFTAAAICCGLAMVVLGSSTAPLMVLSPGSIRFSLAELAATKGGIEVLIVVFGSGFLVAHQYLTRKSRRSLAMAAGIVATYGLIACFWPAGVGKVSPAGIGRGHFDPARLELKLYASTLDDLNRPGITGKNVDGSYEIVPMPRDQMVQVRMVKSRLTLSDGTPVKTVGAYPSIPFAEFADPETGAISAALGGIPVYSFGKGSHMTTLVSIDADTFARYKNTPTKLVDTLDFVISRYDVVAEVPLAQGQRFEHGQVHGVLEDVSPTPDGVEIVVVESRANLSLTYGVNLGGQQSTDPRTRGDAIYVLVNRARHTAALVSQTATRSSSVEIHLGGLIVQHAKQLPFGPVGMGDKRGPVVDAAWLKGATLVCLERVPTAEFEKSAEIELPKLREPWILAGAQNAPFAMRAPAGPGLVRADIEIFVRKDGSVWVDGAKFNDDDLNVALTRAGTSDPTVFIRAEEHVPLQKLSSVMAACRAAGISKFSLQAAGSH